MMLSEVTHLPKFWNKFLEEYLDSFDLKYNKSVNWHEKTVYFTKFLTRKISVSKRKIFISKEFNVPEEFKKKLENIKENIEAGNDLTCYMSTTIEKADYNDYLFNDWNIQHFHLGNKSSKKKFVKRTGPLLYLLITDDAVYFLDVLPHGEWAYIEFLNIINRNWRFLIEKNILKDVIDVKPEIKTDAEVAMMRKGNVNIAIKIEDGSYLISPNLGYASEGSSTKAIILKNRIVKQMSYFENYFLEKHGNFFYDINFKFEGYDNGIFLRNSHDEEVYKFYPF